MNYFFLCLLCLTNSLSATTQRFNVVANEFNTYPMNFYLANQSGPAIIQSIQHIESVLSLKERELLWNIMLLRLMDYGKRSVRTTINDIPTTVEDTIESFEQAYQNAQPFSYQRDWFEILIFFIALLFWTCIIFGLTWWARNKDPKEEARIQKLNRTMIPRCCDHVCPLDRPYIPNKTPFPWGRAFSSFFGIFLFMGAMLGITTFYDKPRTAQRKMCTASRALISCHTAYAQQMPLRLLKKVNPIKQAYHAADGKGPHSPEAIKHHSLLIMFYRTLKKASAPYYKPIKNPVYYGPP